MKRTIFLLILLIVGCTSQNYINKEEFNSPMRLTSPVFENGESIPEKYSCDGDNISPPLEISDVPGKTQSLVLIVDDPDIPAVVKVKLGIEVFDHWVLFNIHPGTTVINEDEAPGIQGVNSAGQNKYTGPCPPDKEHRYFFKLYALNTLLDLKEGATREEVEDTMKKHIIAEAKLMGRYKRPEM